MTPGLPQQNPEREVETGSAVSRDLCPLCSNSGYAEITPIGTTMLFWAVQGGPLSEGRLKVA